MITQVPQGQNMPVTVGMQDEEEQEFAYEVEIVCGDQREQDRGKKTLVLDLDETLVHSSFQPVEKYDLVLPVRHVKF